MTDLLRLEAYDYHLPSELIAQFPLKERSFSRLLHLRREDVSIQHRYFHDILELIEPGAVLILNNSKVFPARLFGTKDRGTKVEVFLLHELAPKTWQCMVHPGKRLKHPQRLMFSDSLSGNIGLPDEQGFRKIVFSCAGDFWEEIHRVGHVPLPPYIHREDGIEDVSAYQTVYAKEPGSVAAPTAGFHFTEELLKQLTDKGVLICEVMLHVGIGTFKPVKTERIDEHFMHSEFCTLDPKTAETINLAKREGRRVICVGTTSTRTLESFWESGELQSGSKWTDIFIYPSKDFKVADALITNFHLPKSTLLMMICAFAGYDFALEAYGIAVQERYRFFSYGDAMFIE
ncbi:MAG: tRNA preQ1(34) S-adenosylmethionine ribosyltransferase-isomerase QueA [Candidatus Cloacimonadaceae bacterium]|nr:tRNA preQ1(34) S-adenosylmethionine ribosyltransferase-isomerase QueA [Candidatus Cloacimonadaceae bacterium]